MAISLLEPGYWQEEFWVAGYFNEDYWPHWPEIVAIPKLGGDDVPGALVRKRVLEWEKQILDLPELERQPAYASMLRREQANVMAMEAAAAQLREEEMAHARMTVEVRQADERAEFMKGQRKKETALRNLVHTKTDKTQDPPLQVSRNTFEMRRQMQERRDERLAREKSNREILNTGQKAASKRVKQETDVFLQRQKRIKQPLTALELAKKARIKKNNGRKR